MRVKSVMIQLWTDGYLQREGKNREMARPDLAVSPLACYELLYFWEQRGLAPADCWNWGKWGHKEYKWKWSFLGWFVGLVVSIQEIFVLQYLGCSSRPVQTIIFLTEIYFSSFVPIAQQSGQASALGLLYVIVRVSGWDLQSLELLDWENICVL
jgi:hypothetical protein